MSILFSLLFCCTTQADTEPKASPQKVFQKKKINTLLSSFKGDEFTSKGLRKEVFSKALQAFKTASEHGVMTYSVVSIADFTLHSSKKRLWTIDLKTKTVLFHTVVTHGKGSDTEHNGMLKSVSNIHESKKSSVGLFKTAETYTGKHGYSLKIDGLEKDFNDNARERAIVIHGAKYARDSFVQKHGKAGRSFGCPAVSDQISTKFIDTVKGGTLYWIYADNASWLSNSHFLQ